MDIIRRATASWQVLVELCMVVRLVVQWRGAVILRRLAFWRDHNVGHDEIITITREILLHSQTTQISRVPYLQALALSHYSRFEQNRDLQDLDDAIIAAHEAITLSSENQPDAALSHCLAEALVARFHAVGRVEDLTRGVHYHKNTLSLCPQGHPGRLNALLTSAKALHFRFIFIGGIEDLFDSIDRVREALTLSQSQSCNKAVLHSTTAAIFLAGFPQTGLKSYLQQAEKHATAALSHVEPNGSASAHIKTTLSQCSLTNHDERGLGKLRDLEAAVAHGRDAIRLGSALEHSERCQALSAAAAALLSLFEQTMIFEVLEESIAHAKEALAQCSPTHPMRVTPLHLLSRALIARFTHMGNQTDLEDAIRYGQEEVSLCPQMHRNRTQALTDLGLGLRVRYLFATDAKDIEQSIAYLREASQPGQLDYMMRHVVPHKLADALYSRFLITGEMSDLEECVKTAMESVSSCRWTRPLYPVVIFSAASSLALQYAVLGDKDALRRSVKLFSQCLSICPARDVARIMLVTGAMATFRDFFIENGTISLLHRSLRSGIEILNSYPINSLYRPALLLSLSSALYASTEVKSQANLKEASDYSKEAFDICPPGSVARPEAIIAMMDVLGPSAIEDQDPGKIKEVVALGHDALSLCPRGHIGRLSVLLRLGGAYQAMSLRTGQMEDLLRSIAWFEEGLELCPSGFVIRPQLLSCLADVLIDRFIKKQNRDDLEKSLEYRQQLTTFFPPESPMHSEMLGGLASLLYLRSRITGDVEDLDRSTDNYEKALSLSPPKAQVTVQLQLDLSRNFADRWRITNDVNNQEKSITYGENALKSCPTGHPLRPISLATLASSLLDRHERDKDASDVELAVGSFEEALSITSCSEGYLTFMSGLYSGLAAALNARFNINGKQGDAEQSMDYGQKALESCLPGSHDRLMALNTLGHILTQRFDIFGQLENLQNAIEYFQEAVEIGPNLERSPIRLSSVLSLAASLSRRFHHTGNLDDLKNSVRLGYSALNLCGPEHPMRKDVLGVLGISLGERFIQMGQLEDSTSGLKFLREAVDMAPPGSPGRLDIVTSLVGWLCFRLKKTNDPDELLECMEYGREALDECPPNSKHRSFMVYNYAWCYQCQFNQSRQIGDLDLAIGYFQESLDSHPLESFIHLALVNDLSDALLTRYSYDRANRKSDLDRCITLGREMMSRYPPERGHPERPRSLYLLAKSLRSRYEDSQYKDEEDRAAAIQFAQESALTKPVLHGLRQLQSAMLWAELAHKADHVSTLEAYRTCLELSERNLALSPTLDMQHEVTRVLGSLPLDAVSYAISQEDLPLAVEMLEQGRALLWAQVRRWRSPLEPLSSETGRELQTQFRAKSRALETLSTSHSPFLHHMDTNNDQYGPMLDRKRELTSDLDKIIERLRELPGLSNFLRLPSWDSLKSVCTDGPVIVINHSIYRSDALIIHADGEIVCVPLHQTFYYDVIDHSKHLTNHRSYLNTAPKKYNKALSRTLAVTWESVVDPVVKKLKELGIETGTRIWWCPTSVVSLLPLHAAGPIPSTTTKPPKRKLYLPDMYISSYTPTLTALIEARASIDPTTSRRRLLAVAPLDATLNSAGEEITVLKRFFSESETLSLATGDDCHYDSVISGLRDCPWAHFACHGVLKQGAPFESAFMLSPPQEITILDIIRGGLHNAELAVLSACHTAEQAEDSASEEALHLAAAMQFSGFRSVVGTMWQLKDEDGPTFAEHFYHGIFEKTVNDDARAEPEFKRAAWAVNSATRKMRDGKVGLERWVNFVHIGA